MLKPRTSPEDQRIRDTAVRESWPLNDPRATYPLAVQARQARAEGQKLADERKASAA